MSTALHGGVIAQEILVHSRFRSNAQSRKMNAIDLVFSYLYFMHISQSWKKTAHICLHQVMRHSFTNWTGNFQGHLSASWHARVLSTPERACFFFYTSVTSGSYHPHPFHSCYPPFPSLWSPPPSHLWPVAASRRTTVATQASAPAASLSRPTVPLLCRPVSPPLAAASLQPPPPSLPLPSLQSPPRPTPAVVMSGLLLSPHHCRHYFSPSPPPLSIPEHSVSAWQS